MVSSRRIVWPGGSLRLPVPLHRALHALLHEPLHQIWTHNVLSEALLLQQF